MKQKNERNVNGRREREDAKNEEKMEMLKWQREREEEKQR